MPLDGIRRALSQLLAHDSDSESTAGDGESTSDLVDGSEASGNSLSSHEYISDILRLLNQKETARIVDPSYIQLQPHLNMDSRAIVVNWLADLNRASGYRPKTLFLAVALLDRYLEKRIVHRDEFQLLGVTSMLLAAKYEEVRPLSVADCSGICDGACSESDIRRMELSILMVLEFRLCQPVAPDFAEPLFEDDSCLDTQYHLTLYLLELSLVCPMHLRYSPSILASSAFSLSSQLLSGDSPCASATMFRKVLGDGDVGACADDMLSVLRDAELKPNLPIFSSVRRRFMKPAC